MPNEHFICYSRTDAIDFARRLCDELESGFPPISTWRDEKNIKPGDNWDIEIEKAIPSCKSLLYLITNDSVEFQSECRKEMNLAMDCKRTIIPLMLHNGAKTPYRCSQRQYIDFRGDFNSAIVELRHHLEWLESPEGILKTLKDRLDDASRDLHHSRDEWQRTRIEKDIILLKKQIADQEKIVDDPQGTEIRTIDKIKHGIEGERKPETKVSRESFGKFINPPPTTAPSHFQDRDVETGLIIDFLKEESRRLIIINGRGGVGKTAMVCRLLRKLEYGNSLDSPNQVQVDGIVYLSANGLHRINLANLFADLCKLLPLDVAASLDTIYKNPLSTPKAKMEALLDSFQSGLFVVLLDNFEDLIDYNTHNILEKEIAEALTALLNLPHHAVKIIITTRIVPRDLALVQPARQVTLPLNDGLPSPFAETILREMDVDGTVGLKNAPLPLLEQAKVMTRGYPKALEALFGWLSADRSTTLEELLEKSNLEQPPSNIVEELVGKAYNRLDNISRQVMQSLSIYGRPVPVVAIDYLLQPFVVGVDSAPVLNRLVNMHFVRKESGRYFMHPIDREYALSTIPSKPQGDQWDDKPDFNCQSLYLRAADYFREIVPPRESWKVLADVQSKLDEFEMRCAGEDYETAADVLMGAGFWDYHYLYPWGEYQLLIDLHEQLRGRIKDRHSQENSLTHLGIAYAELGRLSEAISATEEALQIAEDLQLGSKMGILLGNLGTFESDVGHTLRALERHEQALKRARLGGDWEQCVALNNLGVCFGELGQFEQAQEALSEATILSHFTGDLAREAVIIANLAEAYLDAKDFPKAIEASNKAIEIATQNNTKKALTLGHKNRALAHFFNSDLLRAHSDAETACKFELPQYEHFCLVLLGIIALRQNDISTARNACLDAIKEADKVITNNSRQFRAWDTKGLAQSVLALCKNEIGFDAAIFAHRRAREISGDQGVVKRLLLLYKELAIRDPNGFLIKPIQALGAK